MEHIEIKEWITLLAVIPDVLDKTDEGKNPKPLLYRNKENSNSKMKIEIILINDFFCFHINICKVVQEWKLK